VTRTCSSFEHAGRENTQGAPRTKQRQQNLKQLFASNMLDAPVHQQGTILPLVPITCIYQLATILMSFHKAIKMKSIISYRSDLQICFFSQSASDYLEWYPNSTIIILHPRDLPDKTEHMREAVLRTYYLLTYTWEQVLTNQNALKPSRRRSCREIQRHKTVMKDDLRFLAEFFACLPPSSIKKPVASSCHLAATTSLLASCRASYIL